MIKTKNLSYTYPQRGRGIAPMDITINPGEIVHIKGPSGCGKSTLARCITGIIPHLYHGSMEGTVLLDGMDTASTPLWQLCETAGFVFQNPSLQMLGITVEEEIIMGLENLGLTSEEIEKKLIKSIKQFHLEDLKDRNPHTLSGGEQQKLSLAAVTAREPQVLVLDEPLSMLDISSAEELLGHIRNLQSLGITIVIFEHRTEHLHSMRDLRTIELKMPADHGIFTMQDIPDFPDSPGKDPGPVEIKDLHVALGDNTILENVNTLLEPGKVTSIIGRNGSGKTTLLRALTGLQKFSGSITINGEAPKLGLVFQNADLQLFNSSVSKEITYGIEAPDTKLYEWLIDSLRLQYYHDTPPLMLSEGEKKRVALASIIMSRPDHGILLDEPSLGQDTAHKKILIGLCHALAASGRIAAFTTHDLHLAVMADHLIIMGRGKIIGQGAPGELLKQEKLWKEAGLFIPPWLKENS